MARLPRVNIEGALCYITSRGDHGEKIFMDEKDYIYYIALVKKYKSQFKFKLFAYVLLPDHFHLLLELSRHSTISPIMHSLNSNYTKYFNSSHNRQGHLFQQRYKMAVVEKNAYILLITAYIHTNPKAINLAAENRDYPYSSLPEYLKSARPKAMERSLPDMAEEIREVMERPLKQKGLSSYQDYLDGVSGSQLEGLGRDLAKRPVLGSQEFIRKVNMRLKAGALVSGSGIPAKSWRRRILAAGAIIILALAGFNFYVYIRAKIREQQLKSSFEEKEAEVSQQLKENYQKQIDDYYKGVSRSLQLEKQKAKELEERLLRETEKDRGAK